MAAFSAASAAGAPLALLDDLWFARRRHFWQPRRPVLRGVSLAVPAGACVGLLGPNGAGKTTCIKALLGLLRLDRGRATVHGHPAGSAAAGRHIGYVPERPCLPAHLTAQAYVAFHGRLAGLAPRAAAAKARWALDAVRLGAGPMRLGALSKGMAQRVSLAQALVGDPPLLVLDEPTSGLDPAGRAALRGLFADLHAAGRTLLICTHALHDAAALCSHVAVLAAGRVRLAGRLVDLYAEAPTGGFRVEAHGVPGALMAALNVAPVAWLPASGTTMAGTGTRADTAFACADLQAANRLVDQLRAAGATVARLAPVEAPIEALYAAATAAAAAPGPASEAA